MIRRSDNGCRARWRARRQCSSFPAAAERMKATAPASSGSQPPRRLLRSIRTTTGNVTGKVTFEGTPPAPQPIKLSSDPYCETANSGLTTETQIVGANGAHGERVRLRQGWTRRPQVRGAVRAGHARSEGLPLHAARDRHPGRSADADRQQRQHAPQRPRPGEGEQGIQRRPADPGHEDDAHLQHDGSDGALQVRRPQLDERVGRRPRASVLSP